jgi:hypothetical protein
VPAQGRPRNAQLLGDGHEIAQLAENKHIDKSNKNDPKYILDTLIGRS